MVGREAVANANAPVLGLAEFGTSVAVQGGVPHVENVTVPVGPVLTLCVVIVAVSSTVCAVVTVVMLAVNPVAVVALVTVSASVTGPLGL